MIWLGFRFREDYKVVARRARDQAGDLATAVEESVHGIRVLKAFGRGRRRARRLRAAGRGAAQHRGAQGQDALPGLVRAERHPGDDPRGVARVRCRPDLPRGAQRRRAGRVLRHGGRGQQPGGASRHAARDDARRQGGDRPVPAGHGHGLQRARPGASRSRLPGRGPGRLARRAVRRPLRAPAQRHGGRPPRVAGRTSWRGSTWCWSRGRRWRSSGSPAAARRPCCSWCRGSTTSPAVPSGSTAWTSAT